MNKTFFPQDFLLGVSPPPRCVVQLLGNQFLDQELNPGHSSDSAESQPLGHQVNLNSVYFKHFVMVLFRHTQK